MIANPNDGNSPRVEVATPMIDVSAGGLITATTEQEKGYVSGGTKSATQQLTTQGAKTVTPGTTAQTAVASGRYTTGAVQVAGDANLVPENIAEGVSIFGVSGTHSGGGGGIANVTLIGVHGTPNNRNYGILSISPSGEQQTIYVAEGETKTIKVAINSYALPMIQGDFDASYVVGAAQTNEYAGIYLNNTGHSTLLVYIYGDCTITV